MAKQIQTQADWVDAEDQVWLGRWARQWATDPAHKFINTANLNDMDRKWLGLFDSIEACAPDIDARIEDLHQAWKHSGFLTKQWWRLRVPYLLKGAGYEVSERARTTGTASNRQMLANWFRIACIVNAQGDPDWSIVAKAWVGPAMTPQAPGHDAVATPLAAAPKPMAKWLRKLMGEWTEIGHWRYVSTSGSGVSEGPLAALIYGPIARRQAQEKAWARQVAGQELGADKSEIGV